MPGTAATNEARARTDMMPQPAAPTPTHNTSAGLQRSPKGKPGEGLRNRAEARGARMPGTCRSSAPRLNLPAALRVALLLACGWSGLAGAGGHRRRISKSFSRAPVHFLQRITEEIYSMVQK